MEWATLENHQNEENFNYSILPWLGRDETILHPFSPIIYILEKYYGSIHHLNKMKILELGTGRKTELADILNQIIEY
ncbi:MAG: hypothetical protein ACI86H_000042, partial [bacterium]